MDHRLVRESVIGRRKQRIRQAPRSTKNPEIAKGIRRYGSVKAASLRRLHKKKFVKATASFQPKAAEFVVKKTKNGERKVPTVKTPGRFAAQPESTPVPHYKKNRPQKASGIAPGTILILLAGRFRGKRVVFLKELESGLLLISGPFVVNGVPLRRVNRRYVIATSEKVDISGVTVDEKINDEYFKSSAKKGKVIELGKPEDNKAEVSEERIKDQKTVDDALFAAIKKVDLLQHYLRKPFHLAKGQYPHAMKF